MFTGLVDDVGVLAEIAKTDAGLELRITCRYEDLAIGESVAVSGVCLTVRECGPGWFTAAAVETTLGRTAIGDWKRGRRVNLERALRASDRLGGHIVQGHVDAVGRVERVQREGDAVIADIAVPGWVANLLVAHGSVAVDGVSLTVNALPRRETLQISIIDHTLRATALDELAPDTLVHLEADVIAKYVQQALLPHIEALSPDTAGPGPRGAGTRK